MHLNPEPKRHIPATLSPRSLNALPQLISAASAETLSYLRPKKSLAVAPASSGSLNSSLPLPVKPSGRHLGLDDELAVAGERP